MFRNPIALIVLAIALGFGAWSAYRGSIDCKIKAAFVGGILCPIRAQYPSFVSREVQIEIKRKQEALRYRLAAYSILLNVLSVASAIGCIGCLSIVVIRKVRAASH